MGFAAWGGGGGRGEASEEAGVLTLLLEVLSGDVGEVVEEGGKTVLWRLLGGGGGGRSGDDTFWSSMPAASFCSVALMSATRSAMRASKSLSSSSYRDSGGERQLIYLFISVYLSGTVNKYWEQALNVFWMVWNEWFNSMIFTHQPNTSPSGVIRTSD